jgi:hypothetical protein
VDRHREKAELHRPFAPQDRCPCLGERRCAPK